MLHYTRTATGTAPIDVTKAKAWFRITYNLEDAVITDILSSVFDYAEKFTGRDVRENTYSILADTFQELSCINKNPVNSIEEVRYINDLDAPVVLPTADYYLVKSVRISSILNVPNVPFPTDINLKLQSVSAIIKVGYTTATLPDTLLQAMKNHSLFLFENRGSTASVGNLEVPTETKQLYSLNKIIRV